MPNAKKHIIVQAGLCSKSSVMFVIGLYSYASFSRLVAIHTSAMCVLATKMTSEGDLNQI